MKLILACEPKSLPTTRLEFQVDPPLIRSTRYSWFGVMSRYCTIEVMVGMADAFITAACFRLLMLASSGEKRESHESFNT